MKKNSLTVKGNLLLALLVLAVFFCSCAGNPGRTHLLIVRYQPTQPAYQLVPAGKSFDLCLKAPAMRADEDRLWYRLGDETWNLEKEPTRLMGAALKLELQRLGLKVRDSSIPCPYVLEFQIRWFAPYGHNPATAALMLALSLYHRENPEPIWRGRLRAGAANIATTSSTQNQTELIQAAIEETLAKTMRQLAWQPEFTRIVSIAAQ